MDSEGALSAQKSKAQRYGLAGYPRFLADAWTAVRMASREGLTPTLRHAWTIGLLRLHAVLIDRRLAAGLPYDPLRRTTLEKLTLSSRSPNELADATAYCQVPAKIFQWSIEGLGIDPSEYDFVDLGSGRGFALLLAAAYPFRSITGVEFARELYDEARANIAWAGARQRLRIQDITLLHASALDFPIPDRPTVFFLYNPFTGSVMEAFLDRLMASLRSAPRPHRLLYVNAKEHRMVEARGFVEVPLGRRARLLLRALSPFEVRVYQARI
jgi:SAM-dependent methyltransferase